MSENTENTGRDASLMEKYKSLLPLKKLKKIASLEPKLDLIWIYSPLTLELNLPSKGLFVLNLLFLLLEV